VIGDTDPKHTSLSGLELFQQLKDGKTINDYNIRKEMTINLIIDGLGGITDGLEDIEWMTLYGTVDIAGVKHLLTWRWSRG
jgi:hypothetical protein